MMAEQEKAIMLRVFAIVPNVEYMASWGIKCATLSSYEKVN